MFLGAGSVMHGTMTRSTCAATAPCERSMPVTFLTFAIGYLAIIGLPRLFRLLLEGQDHRGGVHPEPRPRPAGPPRCRVTGFYMTRADADDVLRQGAVGTRRTPARVAQDHDLPADRAGGAVPPRRPAAPQRLDRRLPQPGRRHPTPEDPPIPAIDISGIAVLVGAIGVAIAWMIFGRREVPREAPTKVSVFTTAGRNDALGDALNQSIIMRPGLLVYRGPGGLRPRGGRWRFRRTRAALAGLAGRLRAAQTGTRAPMCCRCSVARWLVMLARGGEPVRERGFPWLTVLGLLPSPARCSWLPCRARRGQPPKLVALGAPWSPSCSGWGWPWPTIRRRPHPVSRSLTGSSCSAPTTRSPSTASP